MMLLHLADVLGIVADGQDAAVDVRIQGLDAAIHDLREPRDVADIGYGDTGLFDGLHRAARRDDLNACFVELAGEFDDALFIRYADESALDLHGVYLFLSLFTSCMGRGEFFRLRRFAEWPSRLFTYGKGGSPPDAAFLHCGT